MESQYATVLKQPIGTQEHIVGGENGQLVGRVVREQSSQNLLEISSIQHSSKAAAAQSVGITLPAGTVIVMVAAMDGVPRST